MEELVAELGAAFLCADLQITDEPRDDHAHYLAHWPS
jgi:antirestriction protein ArdC